MIDERLERAVIALFKASTNWAKTSDRYMVLNLWSTQMEAIRDSFRAKARAVMAELDEPSDMEPPADMGNTLIVPAKDITDNTAERKALNKIKENDLPLRHFVLHHLDRLTCDAQMLAHDPTNLYDVHPDLLTIVIYRELIKEMREQMEIAAAIALFEGASKSNIACAAGVTQDELNNAMPDLDQLEQDFKEVLVTGRSKTITMRGGTRRILHPRTAEGFAIFHIEGEAS